MDDIHGKCLCGEVEFELHGALPNICQCHCSLCRKVTGSSANASLIVSNSQFTWVRGQALIHSYISPTGYRSDFCSMCGSPVPNRLSGRSGYWVPVGLLDENPDLKIAVHLYTASRAKWDYVPAHQLQYSETPGLDTVLKILRPEIP
ncbi:MAG: GFA family protein [Thiobacillus sp.]